MHRVGMQSHDIVFSETTGNYNFVNRITDDVIQLHTVRRLCDPPVAVVLRSNAFVQIISVR